MSHHYSGPDYGFPHGDARLDLTDLYAFPKPGEAGKSILIMNVHPSAGVNPAGATTAEPFATDAIYEWKIDTNGDAVADIAYRVRFSATANGQSATVRRVEGEQAANTNDSGQIVLDGAPVSTGFEAHVTEVGDYRFFAGWRSEPFFFDTQGALNNLQFTGADFFAGADVCSIVLELPNSALGHRTDRAVGAYGGPSRRRMGSGRPRRAALAIHLLDRCRRRRHISPRCRRTMPVSSRHSRTLWSIRAGTLLKKRCEWRAVCCQTSFVMSPRGPRHTRAMVGRFPTT